MLAVQEFLLTHSFAELSAVHGVNARPSSDFSKWSLNYDQLEAKPRDPVADQCRGLVIRPINKVSSMSDPVGPTEIVARPMDRFYNADDHNAHPIDWSNQNLRVQEKVDGTMTALYWDSVKSEWCVGTRSVCEADLPFGEPLGSPLKNNTFAELFWYAAEDTLYEGLMSTDREFGFATIGTWLDYLNKAYTYVFELTSPLNRVVVKYDDYRITLLAIRVTATGEYVSERYSVIPTPKEWNISCLSALTAFVDLADPMKCEGAVVVDSNWNRVKVKSKAWVLASRMKDAVMVSKRNVLLSILDLTIDKVIPLLDKGQVEAIHKLEDGLMAYCKRVDILFSHFIESESRKDFALKVQASGEWQTPFFNLYSRKWTGCAHWLQDIAHGGKLTPSMLDTILTALHINIIEPSPYVDK